MGPGLSALLVFIALIVAWAVVLKRNITEAAALSLVILPFFGGFDRAWSLMLGAVKYALNYEVLFASLAFVFMSFLLQNSNVLTGMLEIFTRLFGRLKGGPAYANTAISSVLGCFSGGNTPNAATAGAFTANWLMRSGWKKEQAATLIAGNGGLGAGFPPSASLFLVLGFPTVAGVVSEGGLYVALFAAGLYQVLWRVVYIHFIVRKNRIQPMVQADAEPVGVVFRKYGINLLLFMGAVIPVMLTMGPIPEHFSALSETWDDAMGALNLLVWLPVLMILIILLLDGKNVARQFSGWEDFVKKLIPHVATIGGLLFFIFAASNVISKLGLDKDVVALLDRMSLSPVITTTVILVLLAVVAGPLSSTATLTSVGVVSHAILVGVGIDPLAAAVALLVVASTEGASPPASGALFVACGLTETDPPKIYMPLIMWFVIPITVIAGLIAAGLLPLP
ncbi:TRAP transporter large permease subunit [Luteococcus sp. OSA5]|uniref:TRAP transporter large permease subunit n=1 Tax=Luteococcus sp. OSA5 TaxID=3401630 RepID=UPI003B4386B9